MTLTDYIYSMYVQRSGIARKGTNKIFKDITVSGKLTQHKLDVYVEFIQINNLERIVIKTIEDREVTKNDLWNFYNVISDLKFYPTSIIYYNEGEISKEVFDDAEKYNIALRKFNFQNEVILNVSNILKIMLPDEDVIGDPFWIIMEIESNGIVNGNYVRFGEVIPLFLSRKQAQIAATLRNEHFEKKCSIFGLSQEHLRILVSLVENFNVKVGIALNQYEQMIQDKFLSINVPLEDLKKYYLREEK